MKFSEYRRIRRQQEDEEENTGAQNSVPVVSRDNTHQSFTEIMKERDPQRYAYHQMQKEQKRIDNENQYLGKVNSFVQESNMSLASDAGYIKKHKDEYTPDSSEYAASRIETNDAYRKQALELMREAWSNNDLDDESRQKVLDTLQNTAANHKKADDANKSFSDYMSQFANQDAFERTREAERKQEEIANLSEDELQKKIQESEKALEEVKNKESAAYLESNVMNQGVGKILQKMGLYNTQELDGQELSNQKNTLENDIKSYKNAIYQKQQKETLDSLSEETKEKLEKYYQIDTYGSTNTLSDAKYTSNNNLQDEIILKPTLKSEIKESLGGKDFDSVYEYYKFSRDKEISEKVQNEIENIYDDSNIIGKAGMNATTVMSTPIRGIESLKEVANSIFYNNENAPLNINSNNYTWTNFTDTVRNKTSQDIDNGVANFLYQTGMSTADFLALLPINAATGNGASLAIMGTNAATSAAKEATQRGADKKQALLTGLTAGTAEVVFEKLSLDHFWDIARKQGKAATRSAFLNVLAQAGIEGSEEVFTDIANAFTDNLINGGLSEYYQNVDKYYKQGMSIEEAQKKASTDFAYSLGMSFAGGALSGGVIGAGASISTSIQGKKSDYETADYAEVAENMDMDRNSYETQEDYDKAMEVQSLAQDIASKGEKASDFEKGLYMQAAQQLPSVNYMDKEAQDENVTDSVTSHNQAAEVKETLNNVLAGNVNISKQESTAEQIQRIASGLSNETVSKAFVADYKEGVPVDIYTTAFKNFFDAGYTDMPFDKALQANDVIKEFVDSPTLQGIWFLGHNQAELASKEYVSPEQKQLVDVTAKALGVKVEYQDIEGANGMYQNGTIYISNKAVQPAMVVLSHELTHDLKNNVPEEYSAYENYVIEYFKEYHAKEYETLYKSIEKHYGNDEALIREEIAANASETFLTDADAVNSFVKDNRTIAQRIADFLNNFVEKLRNLYKDYKAKGKASKMLSEDVEVYQKARDLWYAAVKNNSENVTDSVTSNERKFLFKGVNTAEHDFDDLDALEKAREMEMNGEEQWKIFHETGWFKGADGKWRSEIDDSKAKVYRYGDAELRNNEEYNNYKKLVQNGDFFNPEFDRLDKIYGDYSGEGYLPDYLVHDDLYSNYPFLKKIKVKKIDNNEDKNGYFNTKTREIGVADSLFSEYTEDLLKETLLHEIQHAIQHYEHFAGGATIDTWKDVDIKDNGRNGKNIDDFTKYKMTAGEIEARDAAERRSLTKEERRKKMPTISTEDGVIFAENLKRPFEPRFSKKTGIEDEIQNWFDNNTAEQRKKSLGFFRLGTTSEVLKNIGLDDVDIFLGKAKTQIILDTHPEMSIDTIKNIPQILEQPIMITSSLSRPKDSIVIFGNEIKDNKAVMISLNISNGKGEITEYYVTSAYGRAKGGVVKYLNDSKYYFIEPDKKITNAWLSALGVQFPSSTTKYGYINRVPQDMTKGNSKFSLKSYSDEMGLRFSGKDDSGISENIERVTDTAADDSENSKVTKLLVQNTAKILQEGVNAVGDIKKANVSKDMCLTLASHYLQTYSASYDKNMLADNLYKIFAYIQKSPDNINYEDMVRVMQEVCKPVIETSQLIDQDSVQQYRDFCKTLKDNPIRLSNGQVAAVEEAYGSFERFKESTKGIYLFDDKNGTYLGDIWDKLVQESGSTLSYDTSSSDQMIELHRYVTSLKRNSMETSGELTTSQNAYDMALNIYTDYFKLIHNDKSIVKNLQDQMKNELKDYKDKANSYYKEKYQKILQDVRLKKDTQIRTLQKQLKQAEFESAAARSRLEGAQENLKTVSQKEYEKALQETMNAAGTIVDLTDEISKLKSRLESVQNRNAEKIAEMEAKNFDSYIGRHRAGKKTALKNHIKRNMTDLQNMLAKPKDNKYIPRELVLATIDLCETVNIDTGRSEKLAEKLNDLSLLYAKMKADPDYALSSEYDENTAAELRRLQAIFNGRNITALELEELEEVDELVNQLHHQITYAGKLIRKEKAEDVYKTAMKCMEEINSAKGYEFSFAKGSKLVDAAGREINKYNTSLLSPKRQFRRMSGYKDDSVLNQLYDELNEGQRKKMQVLMETARMFDEVTEGEHNQKAVRNLTGRKQEDWIDLGLNYKNQEPVMVPKAFRVSLAMHIQNKANLDHIIYGGLTIPEPKAYMRGDYKNAYAQGKTIRFIPDDADTAEKRKQAYEQAVRKLKSVTSDMTQYEKKMLSCAEKFFHEYTGEKINEVSLKLNGYKKARVQNYFPIRTDSNFNHAELEALVRNGTLEGMGMLTSRVGARNPILLEDITQVIQRQSENVAKYYGLAIPIRNFNKIYNTTAIGYQDSTKSTIARKWGADGQKYIENLLVDLQSHRGVEGSIFDTLQGNFSQAVLTNNISVASQQLAAYPTAAATLGHSAVMKGLKYIPTKLDMEHIAKYTPLLWYRNQGTGTQEIGDVNKRKNFTQRMLTDAAIKAEQTGIEPLAKAAEKVEAGGDYLLDVLQRIDTKAVGSLWKASEIYVQDNMGISIKDGEDFFYNEVAKIFNECVDDTQANYSTMQRSDFQRDPGKILKTVFMFMTQPIQNYNIMYDAYGNLRAKSEAYKSYKGTDANVRKQNEEAYTKAKDEFVNAISSQVVAATFIFGMKLLSNVLTHRMDKYRDDEDEISGVKIAESLADEIMANLIGSLVGGKELYDTVKAVIFKEKFYGFETGTVSMLSDFGQSLVKMTSDPSGENLWKVFMDGGSILGVPIENTYKIFRGLYLWGEDFANHEPFSFNAGHETPLATRYSNMLNALLDEDTNKYDKNYKKAKDSLILKENDEEADKAIKSGIVEQLKKRYLSGDITRGQAEEILKRIGQEDIYFVLKQWDNKDKEGYGKYTELKESVISGKNIDEELKELMDHGVTEDTAMTTFWKLVKESYKSGKITKQRATEYLMKYKEDFDDDKVYWELREWDKEDEYDNSEDSYNKNDTLIESVENGTFDTVVKEYMEHGYDASDIKTAISNVYRDKYKELYISGKSHEAYAIRDKLSKLRVNGKRLYGQDDYLSWNKAAKKKE